MAPLPTPDENPEILEYDTRLIKKRPTLHKTPNKKTPILHRYILPGILRSI